MIPRVAHTRSALINTPLTLYPSPLLISSSRSTRPEVTLPHDATTDQFIEVAAAQLDDPRSIHLAVMRVESVAGSPLAAESVFADAASQSGAFAFDPT